MKIWVLISVKRGFIEEPEIFYDAVGAKKRKRELLRECNPDYDEVELFAKQVAVNS